MKDMKRILICFLLCIIASVPLVAKDFVATGYGASIPEAREDAIEALSISISSSVSTLVMTSTYDDGESVSQRYGNSSLQSSDFDPVGMKFGQPQRNDGMWSITVTLPSSSAHLYYDRLEEKAAEIERLYDAMGKLSNLDDVSYDELDQLSDLLASFEVDRMVATGLDRNETVPELPVSRSQVEVQRNAKIQAEEDSLEDKLDTYDVAEALGLLTDEMEADRQELSRRLDELRADSQARIEEMEAQTRKQLAELNGISIQDDVSASTNSDKASAVFNTLEEIGRRISVVNSIHDNVRTLMLRASKDFRDEIEAVAAQYDSERAYAPVMLGEDGKPTEEAKEERMAGYRMEARKALSATYVDSLGQQFDGALSMMISNIEDIASLVEQVDGKRIVLSSQKGELSVAFNGYVGDAFVGIMQLSVGGEPFSIDFSIPGSAWLGQMIPDKKNEYFAYEEYLFVVSQWISMLKSNAGLADVKLELSIHYDPIVYGLYIVFESFSVIRLDNGNLIVSNMALSEDPVLIAKLPFNLNSVFDFKLGSVDDDLRESLDLEHRVAFALDEAELWNKVDLYQLDLDKRPMDIKLELGSYTVDQRIMYDADWYLDQVDSLERQMRKQDKYEENSKIISGLFDQSFLLMPYAGGGVTTSIGDMRRDDLFAANLFAGDAFAGLSLHYLFNSIYPFNLGCGLFGQFGYSHSNMRWTENGYDHLIQSDNLTGGIGASMLIFCRLGELSSIFSINYWASLAWTPSIGYDVGVDVGVLFPAGTGLMDISLRLGINGGSDILFHCSLIAGYAFNFEL